MWMRAMARATLSMTAGGGERTSESGSRQHDPWD
jgi:hypothetical protein